jgi:F0F1-type ATP synthase assembly protein I
MGQSVASVATMRIGKPLLIATTILGVPIGIYEAFHLAGPLGFVAVALIGLFAVGIARLVVVAKAEARAQPAHPPDS